MRFRIGWISFIYLKRTARGNREIATPTRKLGGPRRRILHVGGFITAEVMEIRWAPRINDDNTTGGILKNHGGVRGGGS